jgi:hypothetical protein
MQANPQSLSAQPYTAPFPEQPIVGATPAGVGGVTHPFLDRMQQIGDLDLTKAVRSALEQTSTEPMNLAAYDSHPSIQASLGKAPEVQLYHQKEFWNYQLLALQENANVNTLEDRLLIQQFVDPQSWLTYFTKNVIDLVNLYNMPVRHGW